MSPTVFFWTLVGSTAIDALIAMLVLVRLTRWGQRPVVGGPLVAVAAAWGGVFVLKVPVLWTLGVGPFGIIHLAYLDLVTVPPALVIAVVWLESRRRAPWVRRPLGVIAAGLLACLCPAVGAYATFVEPFALRLEAACIPLRGTRAAATPLRIGVLADIQTAHVTDHEHRAVDRLLAEQPDLILLPGDLFHGAASTFPGELDGLRRLIARLRAPGGVYFALGDADTREELAAICAGTSVRVLVNEVHRTEIQGQAVSIAGVELDVARAESAAFLRRFEDEPGNDVRILISHRPDAVLHLKRPTRIDLVVAGHTHGGQVQVPWFGPPLTLSKVPRFVAAGGYHVLDGRPIYVSRRVGYEGGQAPRIRFLCPPEVSLLTLGGS